MGKLIRFLKGYEKESVIGPLFKLLEACFELVVPLIMANIIDNGIKNKDTSYIMRMCLIMILLGVLGLICSLTAQYFAAKAAAGFGTKLRSELFRHINSFSYNELEEVGTPTLITRVTSDVNQTQTGVNMVLRLFLRAPFIVIGALIMSFTISVRLTMIFIIIVPVISFIIYMDMKWCIPIYKRVQGNLDRVSLKTRENLVGVRVIRAFSRQEAEKKEFDEINQAMMKYQLLVGKIAALLNPMTNVIINIGIIAVIWFGGKVVFTGDITQGEVIALVNYMTQILLALVALANLIISYTKASASAIRINEVFDVTATITSGSRSIENNTDASVTNKVEFKNVSFLFGGSKEEALSNINFTAKEGETIGIIGGTGSGKTSLVNLIPRFYDVCKGQVLVNGIDVKEYTFESLRQRIGVVPQKAVLFKGTIRENMRWGKRTATEEEIYKALEIAQGREFVDQKQEGLDTMIEQEGKNLSGGQRQRLTIARALVGRPEILILDDSASALDFATDAKLRKAIQEETKGMTVFIVSQRATTIKNADKIIVLDDGQIVGIGTHSDLLRQCDVYREICLSQLSKEEVLADEK